MFLSGKVSVSMQYSLALLPLAGNMYILYAIIQVKLCSVQNKTTVGFKYEKWKEEYLSL